MHAVAGVITATEFFALVSEKQENNGEKVIPLRECRSVEKVVSSAALHSVGMHPNLFALFLLGCIPYGMQDHICFFFSLPSDIS